MHRCAKPQRRWLVWGLLFCLLAAASVASGCWDREEIEQLAFAGGLELDKTVAGDFSVTYQQVIPVTGTAAGGAAPEGADVPLTVTQSGSTITGAHRRHAGTTPRRIFLGHLQAIIIGERLAATDLEQALNFLEISREIRRTNRILVRREGFEPLAVRTALETISAIDLRQLSDVAAEEGTAHVTILGDFLEGIYDPGIDAVAPGVEPVEAELHPAEGRRGLELALRQTAVFRETELVGWLNEDETQGFLWTQDQSLNRVNIDLVHPQLGSFGFAVHDHSVGFAPEVVAGIPRIMVNVAVTGDVTESELPDITLGEFHHRAGAALEEAVQTRVMAAVARAQELGSDIFGIGRLYLRHHPAYWREVGDDWHDIYRNAHIQVEVEPVVTSAGQLLEPR